MKEYNRLLDALIEQADIEQTALPDSIAEVSGIVSKMKLAESLTLVDNLTAHIQKSIGFVNKLRVYPHTLKPTEQAVLTEVISWVFASINNWKKADENSVKFLTAVFVIIHFISHDGYLWKIFPLDLRKDNPEILNTAEELIKCISFSVNVPDDAPEYEKEFIKEINNGISKNDLSLLSECLKIINNSSLIYPDILFTSCCRCLATHNIERLAHIVSEKNDFYLYLLVSYCTDTSQALELAASCNSDLLSLIVLENIYGNKKAKLSSSDVENTVNIIKHMTKGKANLKRWMEIFNRYPVRYPPLQKILGQFLAVSDESVLTAYINSIELIKSDLDGYLLVAECLQIFENKSAENLQRSLWKLAFERWDKWIFGFIPEKDFIFKRCISSIDLAVSKYFIKCIKKEEIETYTNNLLKQMNDIDMQWHSSHSDLISNWHTLFSKYALVAYAANSEGSDYLHFVPDIPKEFDNSYSETKYRINLQVVE